MILGFLGFFVCVNLNLKFPIDFVWISDFVYGISESYVACGILLPCIVTIEETASTVIAERSKNGEDDKQDACTNLYLLTDLHSSFFWSYTV